MSTLKQTIKHVAKTFDNFTSRGGAIKMWFYQLQPAKAIIDSVVNKRGLTIVLIISRQAGKDELLVNLISYLLHLFAHREVGIVVANPTYKPQTLNFIMRLENRLKANLLTRAFWTKRSDFMRKIGLATASMLSGDKSAKVVGATASLLLVVNEAQDISIEKYDKDFEPMAASTNATRLIVGTVWTGNTLLAREEDAAREAEKQDGIKRVFMYNSKDVRKVNKPYGQFVDSVVKKRGRQHPLVKTQYFCERIDAIAGMFNSRRMALMQADQDPQEAPTKEHLYAFLIDVAGVDEAILELDGMSNPGRDKTTLSIVDIDLSNLETLQAPTYRTIKRMDWHGENHVDIFGACVSLFDIWTPQYLIIDSTGVGEGLYSMFVKKYPTRAHPFKFTAQSKSELGYGFLSIIDTGRFRNCVTTEEVREQYTNCTSEILIGPQKTMRWGVKDGTRGKDGQLIHDDNILADSLTAALDQFDWYVSSDTAIIEPEFDILEEMDNAY